MNKELLKSVIVDYQIEVPRHKVIARDFHLETFNNYVFVGIRRAGKSYLLYQLIQQLLASGTGWDEILYTDLNLLLELHMEKYGKRPINVYPYHFLEYLKANNFTISPTTYYATESRAQLMRLFDDYFFFGGFPEGATLSSKRDYLSNVYQKIYLGDIATRHTIENTFALRIMFKKIAESVKQPLSFTRLAHIIASAGAKVGTATIIKYMEYAKDAWLITPIQNIAGKLVEKETSPKYYFTDNGILNLFLIDAKTSLLENLFAVTLLRKYGREDTNGGRGFARNYN